MTYDPLDPQRDPFRPPEISIAVSCLHCGEVYDSYLIEWRVETDANGKSHGYWCCPTPGCGGMGFGFDILPTDPHYRDERGGWVCDDDDDVDDDFDEDFDEDFGDEAFDDEDLDEEDDVDDAPGSTFGRRRSPNGNGNGKSDEPEADDEIPF